MGVKWLQGNWACVMGVSKSELTMWSIYFWWEHTMTDCVERFFWLKEDVELWLTLSLGLWSQVRKNTSIQVHLHPRETKATKMSSFFFLLLSWHLVTIFQQAELLAIKTVSVYKFLPTDSGAHSQMQVNCCPWKFTSSSPTHPLRFNASFASPLRWSPEPVLTNRNTSSFHSSFQTFK